MDSQRLELIDRRRRRIREQFREVDALSTKLGRRIGAVAAIAAIIIAAGFVMLLWSSQRAAEEFVAAVATGDDAAFHRLSDAKGNVIAWRQGVMSSAWTAGQHVVFGPVERNTYLFQFDAQITSAGSSRLRGYTMFFGMKLTPNGWVQSGSIAWMVPLEGLAK
jgi:hypothetical protein